MSVKRVGNPNVVLSHKRRTNAANDAILIVNTFRSADQSLRSPYLPSHSSRSPNNPSQSKLNSTFRMLFDENRSEIPYNLPKSRTSVAKPILTENSKIINKGHCKIRKIPNFSSPDNFLSTPIRAESTADLSSKSESPDLKHDHSVTSKSSIRSSISKFEQVSFLTFEEAVSRFKSQKLEILKDDLWILGFLKRIGRCWKNHKLEDENLEAAEHIIMFSLCKFSRNNNFHLSLVKTMHDLIVEKYSEIPLHFLYKELEKCEYPLTGVLNFLFLQKFFETQVQEMFKLLPDAKVVVGVLLDLSCMAVRYLRKEKLNKFVNQCNKCLEVFCFFFAGLVILCNEDHQKYVSANKKMRISNSLKRFARKNTYSVLKNAEIMYE